MEFKRAFSQQSNKELNLIQIFFEITGLQYFSYSKLSAENVNNRPSVIQFFIMIFRLSAKVIFIGFFLTDMRQRSEITNVLMSAIQLAMDIGMILMICSSVLSAYFTTRKIKKFYLIFNDILHLINQNFSSPLDLTKFTRLNYLRFVMIWLSFTGLFILASDFGKSDVFFFLSYIPFLYLILMILHFIFFVELINRALSQLSESVQELAPSGRSMHSRRTILSSFGDSTTENIRKLKIIRRIYIKIYDCASLLNGSFGITNVFILLVVVIASTVSGYKILIRVIEGKGMEILKMNCKQYSMYYAFYIYHFFPFQLN